MNGVSLETRGGGRSMYVAAAAAGLRSVTRKVQRCRWSAVPVLSRRAKWKVESEKVKKAKVIRHSSRGSYLT